MGCDLYQLRWHNHSAAMLGSFSQLLADDALVDCTLFCEGSAFQVFSQHGDAKPVIILKDTSPWEVKCLLDFIYNGEVKIEGDRLSSLLHTAKSLRIRGLMHAFENSSDANATTPPQQSSKREFSALGAALATTPPSVNKCHEQLLSDFVSGKIREEAMEQSSKKQKLEVGVVNGLGQDEEMPSSPDVTIIESESMDSPPEPQESLHALAEAVLVEDSSKAEVSKIEPQRPVSAQDGAKSPSSPRVPATQCENGFPIMAIKNMENNAINIKPVAALNSEMSSSPSSKPPPSEAVSVRPPLASNHTWKLPGSQVILLPSQLQILPANVSQPGPPPPQTPPSSTTTASSWSILRNPSPTPPIPPPTSNAFHPPPPLQRMPVPRPPVPPGQGPDHGTHFMSHFTLPKLAKTPEELPSAEGFHCEICGCKFRYKKVYMKHLSRNHQGGPPGDKKYHCPTCGHSFTYERSFRKHTLGHSVEEIEKIKDKDVIKTRLDALREQYADMGEFWEIYKTLEKKLAENIVDFQDIKLPLVVRATYLKEKKLAGNQLDSSRDENDTKENIDVDPLAPLSDEEDMEEDEEYLENDMEAEEVGEEGNEEMASDGSHTNDSNLEQAQSNNLSTMDYELFAQNSNSYEVSEDGSPKVPYIQSRSSDGRKLYGCPYCGKTSPNSENMKLHIRSHTGERPFPCNECGKRFIGRSDLNRHLRTHTGEKPHKCPHCERTFSRTDNLMKHMLMHDDAESSMIKCKDCHKVLLNEEQLERHRKQVHQPNDNNAYHKDVVSYMEAAAAAAAAFKEEESTPPTSADETPDTNSFSKNSDIAALEQLSDGVVPSNSQEDE